MHSQQISEMFLFKNVALHGNSFVMFFAVLSFLPGVVVGILTFMYLFLDYLFLLNCVLLLIIGLILFQDN